MRGKKAGRWSVLFIFLFSMIFPGGVSQAQLQIPAPPRISGTPNPVGSGARALGYGGAFIAVADDATAASHNPAGLIQLELPEFSVVSAYVNKNEPLDVPDPFQSGDNIQRNVNFNYISAALPFRLLKKNFTASINFQDLFDFNRSLNFKEVIAPPGLPIRGLLETKFRQDGGLRALAPALAMQITPRFSLGATFNFWTDLTIDDEAVTRDTVGLLEADVAGFRQVSQLGIHEKFSKFRASNMNFGLLWNMTNLITVGAVLKTPVTFHPDVEVQVFSRQITPVLNRDISAQARFSQGDVLLEYPISYGAGIAFRFSDAFTVDFDIFRTEWGDFKREGVVRFETVFDPATRLLTQRPVIGLLGADNRVIGGVEAFDPVERRTVRLFPSEVDATYQIRLGGEYLFILEKTIIPLRAGVFYDPEPSHKNPQDFYGFALGSGASLGPLIIDIAYQFRFANGVSGEQLGLPPAFKSDIRQSTLFASAIYHF